MLFQYGGFVFQDALRQLQYWGVWDVLIPFALIFAIIFSILKKTEIFHNDGVNIVVALSTSLLAIIPHVSGGYPQGFDVVLIINQFFPQIALVLISVVMVLIMTGLLVDKANYKLATTLGKWAALGSALIVGFLMIKAINPDLGGASTSFLNDPQLQAFVVAILAFGLVVLFITKGFGGGDAAAKAKAAAAAAPTFTWVPPKQ